MIGAIFVEFSQLILMKIIKIIVANRYQILRLKCTEFNFGLGSAPDPAGGAYSAPSVPLVKFKRSILKGKTEWTEGRGLLFSTDLRPSLLEEVSTPPRRHLRLAKDVYRLTAVTGSVPLTAVQFLSTA